MSATNNGLKIYDTSVNKWKNVNPLGLVSGGTNNNLSSSANGDQLYCNGGKYINANILGQLLFYNTTTPYSRTQPTSGTFNQLVPTTTLTYNNNFSQLSNGVIQFTGTGTWRVKVYYCIVFKASSNNRSIGLRLYLNGNPITDSDVYSQHFNASLNSSVQGSIITNITTNDTLSLYSCSQNSNNETLSIFKFLLFVEPITRTA